VEDLEDDDCDEFDVSAAKYKRANSWLVLGAVFELIADIFMAFCKLFGLSRDCCLQRYEFVNGQRKFQVEAMASIESITSGSSDASTGKPLSG
jgi:hypothetical protein